MAAERAPVPPAPPPPGPGLSLPGVLHFIQHEWARFEAEKGRWEAERAELQAQLSFLQGERKGQENLKSDLVRRIRMLELALKQERSKYHKLKFGADPASRRSEGPDPVANGAAEVTVPEWREGRELLRQYLEELPPSPPPPEDEDDSEDALAEFDFLGSGAALQLECHRDRLRPRDTEGIPPEPPPRGLDGSLGVSPPDGSVLSDLGDPTGRSVPNDGCDLPPKPWSPRLTLRGHFDAVRALAFHPAEPALLTASEDGTLKLWNLRKSSPPKKNAAPDVEPIYAFRGHRGPVLAVTVGCDTALCCSAGVDARIRVWRLPDLDIDPYDGYDPGVLRGVLCGHSDAVWALAFNAAGDRVASCSADGTVRLWDPRRGDAAACLRTFDAQSEHGVPTSVTFSATQPGVAVTAFRTGVTVLYDVEAARTVLVMESPTGDTPVNQVISHPSQPLSITASDDRSIRFLDNRTGQVVHSMVAHLDAVTCLAVDPNGAFLMSGSHDCSLRLWRLAQGSCLQDVSAHRRKHHEGVLAVAVHPRRPLSASAGADAIAKVFA